MGSVIHAGKLKQRPIPPLSSYHKSGKLALDARGRGYGFPVVSSLRDLLEGDDAKYF